ncbi:MAG: methyl-accepting chemotaxis protein [Gallionella sp.]
MLGNMTIKARLIMLVSVIVMMAAVIMIVAFMAITNLNNATKEISGPRINAIRAINMMMYDMADERFILTKALQRDTSMTVSPVAGHDEAKYFDAIAVAHIKIEKHLTVLQSDINTEAGKKLLQELMNVHDAYVNTGLNPAMQAYKKGKYDVAADLLRKKISPLQDKVNELGHKIAGLEHDASKQAFNASLAIAHTSEMFLLLGGVLMLLVSVGMGYSVIAGVTRAAGNMRSVMTKMVDQGDLTLRAHVYGRDEIGQAAVAFNGLIEGIASIIRQVNSGVITLSSTASNLSASSALISQGSQVQNEAAASTAAAVEEMTVSIKSVASNTEDVRLLAEQSLAKTRQGNQNVTAMIGEISSVQNAVQQIAGSVTEFVESTHAIAGMTQQVKDIADQTNLLALNAAIEAARAGEQGRGFAVVADEVRKLAEMSAKSAREIDNVTNSLNDKSTSVEETVQQGLRSLQATHEQVERVSDVLSEAGASVERSSLGVSDIAASVNEQSLASHEIAKNVETIAQMSEENYAALESSAQEVRRLEQLAQELQVTVDRFKV